MVTGHGAGTPFGACILFASIWLRSDYSTWQKWSGQCLYIQSQGVPTPGGRGLGLKEPGHPLQPFSPGLGQLLPPTGCVPGWGGRHRGHWYYRCWWLRRGGAGAQRRGSWEIARRWGSSWRSLHSGSACRTGPGGSLTGWGHRAGRGSSHEADHPGLLGRWGAASGFGLCHARWWRWHGRKLTVGGHRAVRLPVLSTPYPCFPGRWGGWPGRSLGRTRPGPFE